MPRRVELVEKAIEGFRKTNPERASVEQYIVVVIEDSVCKRCGVVAPLFLILFAAAFAYVGKMQSHVPLIVGLVLIAVATVLAFAIREHTPLQRQVILAMFALAGGAITTEAISGILTVTLTFGEKTAITASGALATFIVLYFFAAARPRD